MGLGAGKTGRRRDRGIALLLCLIILVVIFAFVVGLYTWIMGEYRVARGAKNRVLAENNALLGMDLALAKLQYMAGSDQRVTATADLLGTTNGNKHWTGVWDAAKGARLAGGAPDYSTNARTPLGWLVSGSNMSPATYQPGRSANGMPTSADDALLLGGGTVGEAAAQAGDTVLARKMPIAQENRLGQTASVGNYAYWVGDEGVKARLNLPPPAETAQTDWDKIFRQSVSPRDQVKYSDAYDFPEWEAFSNDAGGLKYLTSQDNLWALAPANKAEDFLAASRKTFHDVGYWSRGLLTDAMRGGVREDLSRLFEMSDTDFAAQGTYVSNSFGEQDWYRENDGTVWKYIPIGYLFEEKIAPSTGARGAKAIRGPTWHSLRSSYRKYKREFEQQNFPGLSDDAWNARGSYPNLGDMLASSFAVTTNSGHFMGVVSFNGKWASVGVDPWIQPTVLYNGTVARFINQPVDPGLVPVLTRASLIFSVQRIPETVTVSGTSTVKKYANIIMEVVGAMHNPYDVPIECEGFDVSFSFSAPWKLRIASPATAAAAEVLISDLFKNNYPQNSSVFENNTNSLVQFRFVVTADGSKTTTQKIRLEPGEVMAFSVAGDTPQAFEALPAKRGWNRMGGLRLKNLKTSGTNPAIELADAGTLSVELPAVPSKDAAVRMTTSIPIPGRLPFYFEPTAIPNTSQANPNAGSRRNARDTQDIVYASDSKTNAIFPTARSFTGTELDDKRAIAVMDIQLKAGDASEAVSLVGVNNPRAAAQTPVGNGSTAEARSLATSPSYTWTVGVINSMEDLNIPITSAGMGRWGNSQGPSGQTNVTLWEVPVAPWTNLASFQHVDVGYSSVHQSNAIANSLANPYVPFSKVFHTSASSINSADTSTYTAKLMGFTASDSSYLGNEALWDRFFLSTIFDRSDKNLTASQVAEAFSGTQGTALPNSRLTLTDKTTTTAATDLLDYKKSGTKMAVEGAFNINSVSKEAWKAVLAGFAGFKPEVRDASGNVVEETQAQPSFFSRFRLPAQDQGSLWKGGYHALTENQIDALATGIVEQVKKRGPFLSLSEFVNRRLENSDEGKKGTLQAAIDGTSINQSAVSGGTTPVSGVYYPNPDALPASNYTGLPGYLTQADLLSSIGPNLAARSDTFRVRSYGDVTNPKTGRVEARAWCEAIVQRVPEFVDAVDAAEKAVTVLDSSGGRVANPNLSVTNQKLGRRFKVVAFRWLREDEV